MGLFDIGSAANATGASGFARLLNGPAVYGDSGLTGVVSPTGSGLGAVLSGDLGNALGASYTGLYSGLLPGGGMTGSASGAVGGGISGQVAGDSPIGGATMGALNATPYLVLASQLMQQQGQQADLRAQQPQQIPFGQYADPQAVVAPGPTMPAMNARIGRMLMGGA